MADKKKRRRTDPTSDTEEDRKLIPFKKRLKSDPEILSILKSLSEATSAASSSQTLTLADLGLSSTCREVADLDLSSVQSNIERIILRVTASILAGAGFSLEVPTRSAANQLYVPELDRIVLKDKVAVRPYANVSTVRKTAITTRILQLVHQLCLKNIHVTKRDLFYTDVKLFQDQNQSDTVLDDVSCMLGCTRSSLNVVASEKGVVVGRLIFSDNGDMIDCTKMGMGGKAIPPNIDRVGDMSSDALFILLVEKDAAYMRLAPICFPQFSNMGPLEQHGFARNRIWSIDNDPPPFQNTSTNKAFVDLILKPSEEDAKIWPHSYEFRLRVTLGPGGDLMLTSRIRNTNADGKPFTFTFAYHTYFSVSDISEVRVEGLETIDYLDNLRERERFTEQGDAITFENEVDKIYVSTPTKIAILDHEKKRTFVVRKDGLPDAIVWNPWDKKAKAMADFGDEEYKHMVCVEAAAVEKPITLKPGEEWKGRQELSAVPSSYRSGQLDPRRVIQSS